MKTTPDKTQWIILSAGIALALLLLSLRLPLTRAAVPDALPSGSAAPGQNAGHAISPEAGTSAPLTPAHVAADSRSIEDDPAIQSLNAQRLSWLQEEAVEMAKNAPAPPKLLDIHSRLAIINQQINEETNRLKAAAQERIQQKTASRRTKIYDVGNLVGVSGTQPIVLNADQRAAVGELVQMLTRFLDADDTVSAFNGMVVVSSTTEGQVQASELLARLHEQEIKRQLAR